MENQFSRTEMLVGKDAVERLKGSKVAVFGVGGVGGYAVEVLARSGVGCIDVFDADTVNITNLNRQVIALHSTLEQAKVDARNASTTLILHVWLVSIRCFICRKMRTR